MDVTEAFLTVSMLLNLGFILGIPATIGIRALLRKTKTWVIGLGSVPKIELRTVRKNRIVIKDGDREGDLEVLPQLNRTAADDRRVIFYDRENLHQIAPVEAAGEGDGPARYRYLQHAGFLGHCDNDDVPTVVTYKGKEVSIGLVWQRITGWYLNQKRRSHNVDKVNGGEGGMWDFLQRATPILVLVVIVMMIGMFATIGSFS